MGGTVHCDRTAAESGDKTRPQSHGRQRPRQCGHPQGVGAQNYAAVLNAIARRGFVVIGEARGRVSNEVDAEKVAGQVRRLLAAGVPARNVTVAGHSKGGLITMWVKSRLAHPDIAYVNFAGCGREDSGYAGHLQFARRHASTARGRVLSAYDASDRTPAPASPRWKKMTGAEVTERVLELGGAHDLFHTPGSAWIDVLQAWAERRPLD